MHQRVDIWAAGGLLLQSVENRKHVRDGGEQVAQVFVALVWIGNWLEKQLDNIVH